MTIGSFRIPIAGACLMVALSTSVEAQERADEDPLARFEASECPFDTSSIDVEGLRCGYLIVPESRGMDGGRTLRLAVAIAEPSGATGDPVVLLPGGPGGGSLPGWIARIRQWIPSDRTLVVFDPRGTGYSGPVMCPELNETQSAIAALDLSIEEERLLRRGADLACRDVLLRRGIDLGAYNSTTVALDLIDLRRALGYAQWNIMSGSYGVPFARAAMRLDPEGIRSAVLAIGNPPDLTDLLRRDVPFRAHALDRVFQGCEADPACRALYPNLEEAFYRVGRSFRAEPLTVPVDPERFRSPTFTVNSQDYFAMIGGLLPLASEVPHIPALVRAFDERDVDVVRKLVERHYGGLSFVNWSFGMANSVMCYDIHTAVPGRVAGGGRALPDGARGSRGVAAAVRGLARRAGLRGGASPPPQHDPGAGDQRRVRPDESSGCWRGAAALASQRVPRCHPGNGTWAGGALGSMLGSPHRAVRGGADATSRRFLHGGASAGEDRPRSA